VERITQGLEGSGGGAVAVAETTLAPGNLPLTSELIEGGEMDRMFPRAYVNLSGEAEEGKPNYVEPAFPRRSELIDALLGVGDRAAAGPHPDPSGPHALTDPEKELFKLWVLLGAQYR
jgi:hypothetical protein